jgi:hypothetical protein
MEKLLSYLIVMGLSLLAVAIAYRVHALHKLVFGKGSAHLNHAATIAASAPGAVS